MYWPEYRSERFVSIESGLEGRNNWLTPAGLPVSDRVSIESGLEGRNNGAESGPGVGGNHCVSIESGLEGRNNSS